MDNYRQITNNQQRDAKFLIAELKYCCFGSVYIMIVIFNLALFALVLLSFVMIVGVPVAYAAPQNWDRSKQLLFVGSGAWTLLVVVVAVLNFLVV
jgi:photosystem II PsbZ protein